MNDALIGALRRWLRGPRVSGWLRGLGIDPPRYWLLMDLFHTLSERGEMMDQLGRGGIALQTATILYAIMSAVLTLALVVAGIKPLAYLTIFLGYTTLLLISVLLSETANSLLNPVEGLVLAHQPIDGATYTAAKLTHLVRVVAYLVSGLNLIPAFAGLMLKGNGWFYPVLHLTAVYLAGLCAALCCCAVFGWLLRFFPSRRLRAAGQLIATVPMLGWMWFPRFTKLVPWNWLRTVWVERQAMLWGAGIALAMAVVVGAALGLRALSADYLIRVSSMVRGGATAGSRNRKSPLGDLVARYFGGQPARAGFAFTSRMMLRDWHFRRQAAPLAIYAMIGLVPLLTQNWRLDPFSRHFTLIHLLPHVFGTLLFFLCILLPFGNDYKGAWIFLLAPAGALRRLAGGVWAVAWLQLVVIPHLVLLPVFVWCWGVWHGGLYGLYSIALASTYLALELRLIECIPFTRQADASRGATMMFTMIAGGAAVSAAVAVQYFLVFHSTAIVAAVTISLAAAAIWLTRNSLEAYAASIRFTLGLAANETGGIYREVN